MIISVIASLLTCFVYANAPKATPKTQRYDLQTQLTLDDDHVVHQQLSLRAGERGIISENYQNQKVFVEVAAKPLTKKKYPVELQFTVGQIDDAGNKNIVSTPTRVIAAGNSPVEFDESEDLDHPKIDLSTRVR